MFKVRKDKAMYFVVKNGVIVLAERLGQANGFFYEAEAYQAIEDMYRSKAKMVN